MLEQLIEQLIAEGKITPEEIEERVAAVRATQINPVEAVTLSLEELNRRQLDTEATMVFLLNIALGGM